MPFISLDLIFLVVTETEKDNVLNVFNKNLELPDCSGNLEISSGVYSDIIKVKEKFYELQFQLVSPEASEFKLFFIEEIFAVNI